MSRRGGSSKPTPTPLTVWIWIQEHAKKSSRKKRRPYNYSIVTHQKPDECRRCVGGGRKCFRICRMPPVWRWGVAVGAGKALWQINQRKCTMARRAFVDMEGNTGANTREKSCEKPPAGHRQGGGLDKETTDTRDGRWQHVQPR